MGFPWEGEGKDQDWPKMRLQIKLQDETFYQEYNQQTQQKRVLASLVFEVRQQDAEGGHELSKFTW